MPMIDVFAIEGTFKDKHALAQDLAKAVMRWEKVPQIPAAAGDPSIADRTWVLITESPEGGWGINGHANSSEDIVASARAALQAKA